MPRTRLTSIPQQRNKEAAMVVVNIVDRENGLVLLKHNIRGISAGKLLGPGGKVDPKDESLEAAAKREVREETGLDVRNLRYTGVLRDKMHVVHFFSTNTFSGTLRPKIDEGESRWYSPDEIPYEKMWPESSSLMPLLFTGSEYKFDINVTHSNGIRSYKMKVEVGRFTYAVENGMLVSFAGLNAA